MKTKRMISVFLTMIMMFTMMGSISVSAATNPESGKARNGFYHVTIGTNIQV